MFLAFSVAFLRNEKNKGSETTQRPESHKLKRKGCNIGI